MDCPQCKGYQLEPKEIEPGLMAYVCPKCEGTLLSLMNYRYWLDQQVNVEKSNDEVVTDDSDKVQSCPKCQHLMIKFQIGAGSDNKLDLCVGCNEAWMDKGEWHLLKQLDLHGKLPKIFTDAWQKNIRDTRRKTMHNNRYEQLLGAEDFGKLNEFKQWLDMHPEKSRITAYLIVKMDY